MNSSNFDKMYAKKGFLHHYTYEGASEFDEPRADVKDLISEYKYYETLEHQDETGGEQEDDEEYKD